MTGVRLSWDELALGLAAAVASRADCTRRQVGAVVLSPDHRVLVDESYPNRCRFLKVSSVMCVVSPGWSYLLPVTS